MNEDKFLCIDLSLLLLLLMLLLNNLLDDPTKMFLLDDLLENHLDGLLGSINFHSKPLPPPLLEPIVPTYCPYN